MTILGFLLLIILFLSFFIYCSWLNPDDITLIYMTGHSITFSPALLILGFVLVGLCIGYGAHIYSVLVHGVKHWRLDRNEKKTKEVETIYREGVGRLLSGDLKKARTLLKKSLERDPKGIDSMIALASVQLQDGEGDEAVKLLKKAREIDGKNLEVLFKLATTYGVMDNTAESIEVYRAILDLEAGNRKALRSLRELNMASGQWAEAYELQKRVLKVAQKSKRLGAEKQLFANLRYEVARQRLENGEADKALSEFQVLVKENPELIPAQVSLGDAQKAQGRGADAVRCWQEGYQKHGRSIFLSRLEDYYMDAEDPATLLSFYREASSQKPDDMLLRLFFGKFCLRLEMVEEAIDQLFIVEGSGIESSQLHFLLGEAYRRRDRIEDAVEEYKRALGTNKHLRLGFVCEHCGKAYEEWQSRCQDCGNWGGLSLINRQLFREARPVEVREFHHGER